MAIRYLQNFFEHKKFIGYVAIDEDFLLERCLLTRKSGGTTMRFSLRKCLKFQ